MYTFEDKGGRSVTLRPEGTASVVRSIIENSLVEAGLPIKVYYIAPNFRYEKPQKGRFREHHQFGVECFGPSGPEADAEIIQLGACFLERLGIKGVSLEIGSIGCPRCREGYNKALKAYFGTHIESLCDTCRTRYDRNPMRILDCKEERCGAIAAGAPSMLDYICADCSEHFEGLKKALDFSGTAYTVNPRIVRGLDYYTRTVFEFISPVAGSKLTILAGGRYDRLVEELGGKPTPGLGFGSGIERLLMVMEEQGLLANGRPGPALFLAAADEESGLRVSSLALELRKTGIPVERDLMGRSLKAQMKYASKINARYVAVIGTDEINSGTVKLRAMDTGLETECGLDAATIAEIINRAR
jgi:histidyl-tRNA synthetase